MVEADQSYPDLLSHSRHAIMTLARELIAQAGTWVRANLASHAQRRKAWAARLSAVQMSRSKGRGE